MVQIYRWLNKEKARFYTLSVQTQHPEEIVLNHSWGGCNSNRGGKKSLFVKTEEEAHRLILKMMKRRKSRGYELIFY